MYKLKRILRKLYYLLAFLGVQILFCVPVFAADNWCDVRIYNYNSDPNPFVGMDYNGIGTPIDGSAGPFRAWYMQSTKPMMTAFIGGQVWCFSRDNSVDTAFNIVRNGTLNPPSTWDGVWGAENVNPVSSWSRLSSLGYWNNVNFNTIPGSSEIYFTNFFPSGNAVLINKCDVVATDIQDFVSQMSETDWAIPEDKFPEDQPPVTLPMLNCQLESKTAVKFPYGFFVKHILNWETTQEPYNNYPAGYVLEILASANVNSAGIIDKDNMAFNNEHYVVISDGGCNLGLKSYSWDHSEIGKKLYQTYGFNEYPPHNNANMNLAAGYYIYVRVRSIDGSDEPSPYKIYYTTGNGVWDKTGYQIDDKDSEPTSITDGGQDSDIGGSDPFPSYTNDGSTSAQSDTTSADYNGGNYNPSQVLTNLKAIVNSLGELPSLVAQLFTFFPSWLITLMIASIGMIVVIGTVKLILR